MGTGRKSALLVGASGLVGSHCLRLLLDEAVYSRVSILVRTPLPINHEKLTQHVVDFNELETLGEILTADDVYCCLGTTMKKAGTHEGFRKVDFDYPVKLAALTQHCGASQFLLVSSVGADHHSRFFYLHIKGQLEEAIRKVSFPAFHIFRPSFLLGERKERRSGETAGILAFTVMKYAFSGPLKKFRAIEASDLAKAMVLVAQQNLSGVHLFESDRIQTIAHER